MDYYRDIYLAPDIDNASETNSMTRIKRRQQDDVDSLSHLPSTFRIKENGVVAL